MTFSSTPAVVGSSSAPAASSMVVREVDGSHVITIDGYSATKGLRFGESFAHTFMAAGHRWRLSYYPCGISNYEPSNWISMYLDLEGYSAPDVKARFAISLLDWDGRAVPSCTHACKYTHTFPAMIPSLGFPKFIKRKALERSAYLKGDCFRVRCDITVVTETTTVPPAI